MKKLVCKFMVVMIMALSLAGCGDPMEIKGTMVPTYGLFNEDDKFENVEYEISIGNVIWSIILIETIFMPVYFIGFSLFEPVGMKDGSGPKLLR
jgi:hypothetical protein